MKDLRFRINGDFSSWYILPTIMVSAVPGLRWFGILWLRWQVIATWKR
jgi:hypothetical protein